MKFSPAKGSIYIMKNEPGLQSQFLRLFLIVCGLGFTVGTASAINPKRTYDATPDAIGVGYKVFKINVSNSVTLNSWILQHDDSKSTFIIISGTDAGNMANALGQAKAFYETGYNVVLYDYRGFGESSDFAINQKMLYYDEFSTDLQETIKFVKKEFNPSSVILYGMSMGTIVSRMNLDSDKIIKGLILDSFVINPQLVLERIKAIKDKDILLPEGSPKYAKSNIGIIHKPVLIFSGLKDMVTKTSDYKKMLMLNNNVMLISWDCNHLECFTAMKSEPDSYMAAIKSFIGSL